MSKVICGICPHHCALSEGETGFCRARSNCDGIVTAINYGQVTSMALDPIEKKPLHRYFPGSKILSVGSFGCNLRCSFCQNYQISMVNSKQAVVRFVSPEQLIKTAISLRRKGNIGVAFTYNEPLVGYEYVMDCAMAARKQGLKNVLVTNGTICEEPFLELLPYIDAMNIDLKSFSEAFYQKISGDLNTVKHTIELAVKRCHVEVTTLIIPNENDRKDEMTSLSRWLASVDPGIPLHLSRFFPHYRMTDRGSTDIAGLHALATIAREYMRYVFLGNC